MHRLIYISRSLIGAELDQLDAIIDRSAVLNEACGITGMLWSDGTHFAQVLEGDQAAIVETMRRIRADPRHTDIEVVLDRTIIQRMFGRWAMVVPDAGAVSTEQTAHVIGFAAGQTTPLARRLYDIVIGAHERDC